MRQNRFVFQFPGLSIPYIFNLFTDFPDFHLSVDLSRAQACDITASALSPFNPAASRIRILIRIRFRIRFGAGSLPPHPQGGLRPSKPGQRARTIEPSCCSTASRASPVQARLHGQRGFKPVVFRNWDLKQDRTRFKKTAAGGCLEVARAGCLARLPLIPVRLSLGLRIIGYFCGGPGGQNRLSEAGKASTTF